MRKLFILFFGAVISAGIGASAAVAQTAGTIYLDYANVIATGSTIILNRLPIKTSNGTITYKDVTIGLKWDSISGLSSAILTKTPSPAVLSASFQAGVYGLTSNLNEGLALTGPGVVPGNSMSKWEVNATTGKTPYCGTPAIFYVGALTDNPFSVRIKAAGITNIEYSYGIVGSGAACIGSASGSWSANALVGFSQSGPLLTIATFTTSSDGKDHNVPVTTYTYQVQ